MKDKGDGILGNFVQRLKKEALLKASLCALAVAFGALLLTALICWLTEFGGYWIFAIVLLIPFAAATPLFYFYVFYPTEKYVAKRLDKLGLDERILTMVEFGDQDSYIMQRQREDAIASLNKFNSKLVKFALSAALIAVPVVAFSTATAMTSVYALSEAEVIPSGKELLDELRRDKTTFELVYKVPEAQKGYGVLYSASCPEGAEEIKITVGKGQDGEAVLPVATGGYVFRGWSDGVKEVIRRDLSVEGKIVVTAIFEELDLEFKDDRDEDACPPPWGVGAPPPSSSSDGNGGSGENSDPNQEPAHSDYESKQYVFDGQTDYGGKPYEDAYETAMEELNQSGGADEESKKVAAGYFDSIKR